MNELLTVERMLEKADQYASKLGDQRIGLRAYWHYELMYALYLLGASLKQSLEQLNEPIYPDDVESEP